MKQLPYSNALHCLDKNSKTHTFQWVQRLHIENCSGIAKCTISYFQTTSHTAKMMQCLGVTMDKVGQNLKKKKYPLKS